MSSAHTSNLRRACYLIPCLSLTLTFLPSPSYAQSSAIPPASVVTPASGLKYDVVSIHLAGETPRFRGAVPLPDQTEVILPLADMVAYAYGVRPQFVFGGDKWTRSTLYDVVAKVTTEEDAKELAALSGIERAYLFQNVLTQYFGLHIHHEDRKVSVFTLVMLKNGPGPDLHPSKGPYGGMAQAGTAISGKGVTLDQFSKVLSSALASELGRPILDKTGLDGPYDFVLRWEPSESSMDSSGQPDQARASRSRPNSVYAALEEQLGLKLQPAQVMTDTIVIDAAARPE